MAEFKPLDTGLGLKGSHVLVTGSSGAIGRVVVQAFLSTGAFVSGVDKIESRDLLVHDNFHAIVADVTDESQIHATFMQARSKFGVIAVLIATAGLDLSFAPRSNVVDMSFADWRRVLDVNIDGTFLTCREWLRGIRDFATQERNLSAVIFGSEAGRFGAPNCASYAVGKAAIQIGLVRSLARDAVEIRPDIRVNSIAPGPVQTRQFMKECQEDSETLWREAEATVALRKPVTLEAVAKRAYFSPVTASPETSLASAYQLTPASKETSSGHVEVEGLD